MARARRQAATPHERQRTCVGCRTVGSPAKWLRVATASDGTLAVGHTAPGRGAWLCGPECFDHSVRRRTLARALRRELTTIEIAALRARLFD